MYSTKSLIITALYVYHFIEFVTTKDNQTQYLSALCVLNSSNINWGKK